MKLQRTCGECIACCKTHGVKETGKPSGEWCQHCSNKGCGIYLERPMECMNFKCAWLMGVGGVGPQYRPDKTKIVPEHREIPGIGLTMWMWELQEKSLGSVFARTWSRRNLLAGNCVMHVSLSGEHRLYLSARVKDSLPDFVFGTAREKVIVVRFPDSVAGFA